MNVGYPDTKNKQGGGHSPLLKKKGEKKSRAGRWISRAAERAGKIRQGVQNAVDSVKSDYNKGRAENT